MKKFSAIVLSGFISFLFFSCSENVVLENGHFRYEISGKGKNLHFIDKATGIDYLLKDTVSYCSYITEKGKKYLSTSIYYKENNLVIEFGDKGKTAKIQIVEKSDHISFKVLGADEQIDSLTFLNIPLNLEGMPSEPFAACALSMNLFTQVDQLPALQTHLKASCYRRFGIGQANVSLVGVPRECILPVIRNVMGGAKEVPRSTAGGAWAIDSKEGYGSYLMNFGSLTCETVDEWIDMCSGLGFTQIDSHGGGDFFKFGDFELNREKWPNGWDDFKTINEQLHQNGISSIFHTYAFFIDKSSKYVSPVPHKDLAYFSSFTLSEPLGAGDTEITVEEPTEDISTIKGFFTNNSTTLRIGDELIEFKEVTKTPPYKFTKCKRGAKGTKISSHQNGEKAFHLKEKFGRFVPGPETDLFDEIARNTAEIVNKCNFDGLYFDAIDGGDLLDGIDNLWYYGSKFIFEVAKHLERPVGMEMSTMYHHFWHYRSRWQAYDRPMRGYKKFIDIHAATIKSSENVHGACRNHSFIVNKYAESENGSILLPLHLGWWGNQTWNPPQVEPTFTDDIEYLCCKMIGNNAGMSMLGGADKETLEKYPVFGRLANIIRQYEDLRHRNYFNDSIKSLLRKPDKEFTLFQQEDGEWNFKPVAYQKHKVLGLGHGTARWAVHNEFEAQPVRLRIEPLMSVGDYDGLENIVLAEPSETGSFSNKWAAGGVMGELDISDEKTPAGETAFNFVANKQGSSPQKGSWVCFEKKFEPVLDLEGNKALGIWVKGDGNGQLLNIRLESPEHISFGARGDHYIKVDFNGWEYFELVEIESAETSNYNWPGKAGLALYDSYRHTLDFKKIDKIQLWYNNLPHDKEVKCLIGSVKALPMIPVVFENPSLTIGNEKIVFPVSMEAGMYLEFNSPSDCKLYSPEGKPIKEITVEGMVPSLAPGENEVHFSCESQSEGNVRAQVTIIGTGKPIIARK